MRHYTSKDQYESGYHAGFAGGATMAAMQNAEASTKEAVTAAILVAGVTYLFESWQKTTDLDAVKERAVAIEAQRIKDKIFASWSRAERIAGELSVESGWKKSEVQFTLHAQAQEQIQLTIERNDIKGLLKLLDEQMAARPRDLDLRLSRNSIAALADDATPSSVYACAQDSLKAAALIPWATIYDGHRERCDLVAAILTLRARWLEIAAGVSATGSTDISKFSVLRWKRVLECDPADVSGEIRQYLASALLSNGEVTPALRRANEVFERRKDTPEFCYLYACITSRQGNAAKSIAFLRRAIRLGFLDIEGASRDPDLAFVRQHRKEAFDDLTRVKVTWRIEYGFLSDSVSMTNSSAFPLTNVVLDLQLQQGDKSWNPSLNADAILPGQQFTWSSALEIPGSYLTKSSATMCCDQRSSRTKVSSSQADR